MRPPHTNAEGKPEIRLTEEQRYIFDTKGWVCIPSVLTESEVTEMRDFCYRLRRDPESLPAHHRSSVGGPLLSLIDQPNVLGFMNEFVSHGANATEQGYGFRLEGSFLALRKKGETNFSPHGGSGYFNVPGNSHSYNMLPGQIHPGLTRAVFELNPVEYRKGGTLFLSGSHKAAFPWPPSVHSPESPLWETYSCPAGSLLIFTEAVTHTGDEWRTEAWDRVAVFNCYNVINAKWHKWTPHPDLLVEMHPLRKSLVRGVYCEDNAVLEE